MIKVINENTLKTFPVNDLPGGFSKECVFNLISRVNGLPLRALKNATRSPLRPLGFDTAGNSLPCQLKWVPLGLDYGTLQARLHQEFDHWIGAQGKGSGDIYPPVFCTSDPGMHSLWQIKVINDDAELCLRCASSGGFLQNRNGTVEIYAGFNPGSFWIAEPAK